MAEASRTRPLFGLAVALATLTSIVPADAGPRRLGGDTITVFAGPCREGGCAVYRVAVRSDGTMTYEGLAHTSVLGSRSGVVGRDTYAELASTLAPYRPRSVDGGCSSREGGPTYRVTWTGGGGARTLYHTLGCNTARDNVLDAILTNAPSRLGIGEWSAAQQSPAMLIKPHIFYF